MPKVVYLTGAPAAGKSSTTRLLAKRVPELLVWEYGARLTEHISARCADVVHQDELRTRSAGVVTPEDVNEVDQALVAFVTGYRGRHPIIIDSHAVTKEEYGYRITPFSLDQFARLAPDEIWVLFASPEVTRARIAADAAGRPMMSEEEARMHTALQASVAATYGMSLGLPVYLFDTGARRNDLVGRLAQRLT
jgi:adenylate kinase